MAILESLGYSKDEYQSALETALTQMDKDDEQELLKEASKLKFENPIEKIKHELNMLKEKQENKISNLDKIYMDKIENKINEDMYNRISTKLYKEIDEIKLEISEKEKYIEENNSTEQEIDYKNLLEEFISMKEPSREMILRLVDRIDVHADKQLDIYFNFKELNNF